MGGRGIGGGGDRIVLSDDGFTLSKGRRSAKSESESRLFRIDRPRVDRTAMIYPNNVVLTDTQTVLWPFRAQ